MAKRKNLQQIQVPTKADLKMLNDMEDDREDRKPIKIYSSDLEKIILTNKQKELVKVLDKNHINIILGPAGSAKSFMSCYYALQQLANHKTDNIILTKPVQEAGGEKLGALPGSLEEKTNPYLESLKLNLIKIIGASKTSKLFEKNVITFKTLAFMRGANFDGTLILDEAQNCSWRQLMLFVTRMGKDSKIIINGDTSQYDIEKKMVALLHFKDMVKDIKGVGIFEFQREDIMRHPILIEITDRYEKLKYSGKLIE